MKNPFGDEQLPGSRHNLQERLYQTVSEKVHDQVRRLMVQAYEEAVAGENVVLSRPERNRLFVQIVRRIFDDLAGPDRADPKADT